LAHPTLTSSCSFLFKTSVPLISRKKDLIEGGNGSLEIYRSSEIFYLF
jgi:hypothetical protein